MVKAGKRGPQRETEGSRWSFLTNHGRVLLAVAQDPQARMRDLAEKSGITERAVQKIIKNLVDDGYLVRSRVGRGNVYNVKTSRTLSHPAEAHLKVGSLILSLSKTDPASKDRTKSRHGKTRRHHTDQ